ncbi:MAG TPA: hypothetical protein VK589_23315 [Chryseolinea sp.]|nr:hypothetical protein [Chryseolinea sp.]
MLHYFRINDPYRLFGLLAVLLIIVLPLLIDPPGLTYPELKNFISGEKVREGNSLYVEIIDSTAPLAAWFNAFWDLCFGRSVLARHILAFVIIFLQASYLGIVFSSKKAFAENTYIPSLIFAILFTFSFDTISLTPELVGSGFLLLALNSLFKQLEFREQGNESIFNLGLYIGIASLFALSFAIFIIGCSLILIFFTRSSPRQYFLMIFGFLLPHTLLLSGYYVMDGINEIWIYFYLPNLAFHSDRFISNQALWTLAALPLLFLFISLITMNRDARLSKYQTQLVQSMFFWMIFSVIQILVSKDFRPQSFITLIPSLSFFITHFLLLIRRRKFAEMYVWLLIIGIVTISYTARYNIWDRIAYDSLLVGENKTSFEGKRVLALDGDYSFYTHNELASPFLSWTLSKEIFGAPGYYENVIVVYKGLNSDPPDVIRDKDDQLKPFLEQIPKLKGMYSRNGIYYVRNSVSN